MVKKVEAQQDKCRQIVNLQIPLVWKKLLPQTSVFSGGYRGATWWGEDSLNRDTDLILAFLLGRVYDWTIVPPGVVESH